VSPMGYESTGLNTPLQKECNDKVGQKKGHGNVMGNRMMLGLIITKIRGPGPPVDKELALAGPVLDPIIAHVYRLGSLLFDGVTRKTIGSGVVYLHWCRRLRMTKFFRSGLNWNGFLAIDESGSNFGLSRSRGHHIAHDPGDGEDGTIQGRRLEGRYVGSG
jgi:hypothetical protein